MNATDKANEIAIAATDMEHEIIRLRAELMKYRNWFDQNGSVLATHRIGGFEFASVDPGRDNQKS